MEESGRKRKAQPSSAPNIPLQACSARHGPIASSCLRASLCMIIRVRVAGKVWVPGKAERFIFPSQSRRGLSSASDRAPRRDMRRATICMYDATGKPCQPQSRRGSRLFQLSLRHHSSYHEAFARWTRCPFIPDQPRAGHRRSRQPDANIRHSDTHEIRRVSRICLSSDTGPMYVHRSIPRGSLFTVFAQRVAHYLFTPKSTVTFAAAGNTASNHAPP